MARSKLGFSPATKSHAAFSASVFDRRYAVAGELCRSSILTGFQDFSVKVCEPSEMWASSRTEANEEVTMTLLTVGADRLMALRMLVVPTSAGSISSFWASANQIDGVVSECI